MTKFQLRQGRRRRAGARRISEQRAWRSFAPIKAALDKARVAATTV